MSKFSIDLVCPPFHGHLNPILGIGRALQQIADIRVLTTEDAIPAVTAAGFCGHAVLKGRTSEIWGISNTMQRVNGHPWRMWRQLQQNLALLPALHHELNQVWQDTRPALAIVDFTLPTVGHLAKKLGMRWWTSCPSPLTIETHVGTPSYLGGWLPPETCLGRVRDAGGRSATRFFKWLLFMQNKRAFGHLGIERLYRDDGTECTYSNDVIIAAGLRELEFPRDWPSALRFIGPVLYTPPHQGDALRLALNCKNVLVTVGTHLPFVRTSLARWLNRWCQELPEICFHVSNGGWDGFPLTESDRLRVYHYLNYDEHLGHFDAVVHHGGAGIIYHALRAGLPSVAWPQDYDQFDFAARLSHAGAAVRCRAPKKIPSALQLALASSTIKASAERFAWLIKQMDAKRLLQELCVEKGVGQKNEFSNCGY